MSKSFRHYFLISFLFVFTLISDQVSKILIVRNFHLGESLNICSIFNIVRVHNKGVTFGMFSGSAQPIIFIILSLIIVGFLVNYAIKHKNYRLTTSLIVGGAIGNVIDRFLYKSVVDFLDFHIGPYHWPAFNIADSAIVIGVFVMFWISYQEDKRA